MTSQASIGTAIVRNETETADLAARLAAVLKIGDIITLNGTLGAGKTAFARALIRALTGADIDVPSPTFNLLLTYDTPSGAVFHYDFYRLEDPEEVWELDIEEAYEEGITLIEWVEKLEDLAPENVLDICIELPEDAADPTIRHISLTGSSDWGARLEDLAL